MNKAFIFDMDGVLIDSEPFWTKFEEPFFVDVFGPRIAEAIGHAPGRGRDKVYEEAVALGAAVGKKEYDNGFDDVARRVYANATLTPATEDLIGVLTKNRFRIGLVTQSPTSWLEQVLPRLPYKNKFGSVISLSQHPDLRPKPNADGYLAALAELESDAAISFVLEDSNFGIQAGKAAGCYTIGYRGNLLPGYQQTGADAYADAMMDVIQLVESFDGH